MRDLLVFALLLPSTLVAPIALAQGLDSPPSGSVVTGAGQTPPPTRPALPPALPRVGAQQLLGGRPALTSFEPLTAVLARGHEVILTDEAGRVTRGRISSISSSGVVLVVLRPREERSFTSTSVRRIQIVDSKADGALRGLAVAGGLVASFAVADSRLPPSNLKGVRTAAAALVSPLIIWVAAWIDGRENAAIYHRQSQARRLTINPAFGLGATGVSVGLSF